MNNQLQEVPGIGISGIVMCPHGFQKSPCQKGGCEHWVTLTVGDQKVGRCATAWQAILATEQRASTDRLNESIRALLNGGQESE